MEKKKKKGGPGRKVRVPTPIFSERLSDLIEEDKRNGRNQGEIASSIGVASGALSQWADDASTPTIDNLERISRYFNVTSDYLLGITDDPAKAPAAVDDLGLSVEAISSIREWKEKDKEYIEILDKILCDPSFPFFLESLSSALAFYDIESPSPDDVLFIGEEWERASQQIRDLSEKGRSTKFKKHLIWAKADLSTIDIAEFYRQKAMKEFEDIIQALKQKKP